MQENVCKKYDITKEQLKKGVDIVSKNLGLICEASVLLAVTELLVNADIKPLPTSDNCKSK